MYIFTLHLQNHDYPLYYDGLFDIYYTPARPRSFDTLIELQVYCNEIDGGIVLDA